MMVPPNPQWFVAHLLYQVEDPEEHDDRRLLERIVLIHSATPEADAEHHGRSLNGSWRPMQNGDATIHFVGVRRLTQLVGQPQSGDEVGYVHLEVRTETDVQRLLDRGPCELMFDW